MDDSTERDNSLDGPALSALDDRLDGLADRLGSAPPALAGLESGTVFWALWGLPARLPILTVED